MFNIILNFINNKTNQQKNQLIINKIPELNNLHIITLDGNSNLDLDKAATQLKQIAESNGHSVKIISIVPTVLSQLHLNEKPKWRYDLHDELYNSNTLIINKVQNVNYAALKDFNNSVIALNKLRNPHVFKVFSDETELQEFKKNPYNKSLTEYNYMYALNSSNMSDVNNTLNCITTPIL